jgi:broad specificity phosphatase PhoE
LQLVACEAAGQPVIIVTHAEIIRCALITAFELSLSDWVHLQPDPASLTILRANRSGALSAAVNLAAARSSDQ